MRFELDLEEFLYFTDRALDGMMEIVGGLGDDLANSTPNLPGANSPVAILVHCLGVIEFWTGAVIAGRVVRRDRSAEFTSVATVADLTKRVAVAKTQMRQDLATMDSLAPPRTVPPGRFQGPDRPLIQGAALVHVLEELTQHHGHVELSRDILLT